MGDGAIKPDQILKELGSHWTNMGTDTGDGHEQGGLLRACSMTLTCFADDEEDPQSLGETLAMLMREHPSRLIVVRLREVGDELSARVSSQCWMPFGHGRQICCEQVEISASINRLADAASIVAPIAAPDLPRVVLLRSARIVRAGALRKILALGDKIIVDSSRSGAPGFGEVGGLLDAGHMTGDLAWTRLTPIRNLIARLLDGHYTPENGYAKKIAIEYAGKEAAPETRYLQAWLETSLPGVEISVRGTGKCDTGSPVSEGRPAAVRIDDDLVVRLCAGGAEYEAGSMIQRASIPDSSDAALLNEELGIVVHDRIFEKALNHITA